LITHKHTFWPVLALICLLAKTSAAQESLGSSLDNYSPVNGMMLNPSAIVDQRPWLDLHLLGIGGFALNNSGYLKNSSLTQISTLRGISYNTNPRNAWAQVDGDFLGPSLSVSKGKHAFGFHTAARLVASA